MPLTPGSAAPAFALLNADGESVDINDLRGQWAVLYFYPKDDTPGCTTEACEFTASIGDFQGLNATVVGVSPDSPDRHRKFIEKYGLAVTLLSDSDHKTMEAYGAWGAKKSYGKETIGVIRSTALIDPDGKIAHHWATVTAKGHAGEVKAKLEELQAEG